jgi:hypothetical protein
MKTPGHLLNCAQGAGLAALLFIATPASLLGTDLDLRLVSKWPASTAWAVAVSGKHAYLAGDGLEVIDISNPAKPQRVGGYDTNGWASGMVVSGSHAYVADRGVWDGTSHTGGGLVVVDVSDPAHPQQVGGCETGGEAWDVAVSGNYACVADSGVWEDATNHVGGGLVVLDISNSANPQRVGGCDTGGFAYGVAVSGHYAYVADFDAGFQVIDISNPTKPQRVGSRAGCAKDVAVSGNYAYVVGGDGLEVIDVTDPTNPKLFHSQWILGSERVWISGGYAFVACYVAPGGSFVPSLSVIDIADPAGSKHVGSYPTGTGTWGVAVSGNYAYVADGDGLTVIDISPANPQRVGGCDTIGESWAVAVSGNYTYVAGSPLWHQSGLQVIDISSPANPQQLGGVTNGVWTGGVALSGTQAYVAAGSAGLLVIDVSNSVNPQGAGSYVTNGVWARDVAVSGNYAYVADSGVWEDVTNHVGGGLVVVDISNPAEPHRVGAYDTGGEAWAVAVSGTLVYVADRGRWDGTNIIFRSGLHVVDVSNPANPHRLGGYDTDGEAWAVAVSGNYAYVAEKRVSGDGYAGGGLQVVDVSNPARPLRVGGCDTSGWAVGVVVSGNLAYVGDWHAGLKVLDVSDPANPRLVGGNSSLDAFAVAVAGNYVYAGGRDGLVILNLYQPPPRLESLQLEPDGFRLLVRGGTGQTVRLERSRNLLTWDPFATVPIPTDGQTVIDPVAITEPFLFYRAVSVP